MCLRTSTYAKTLLVANQQYIFGITVLSPRNYLQRLVDGWRIAVCLVGSGRGVVTAARNVELRLVSVFER